MTLEDTQELPAGHIPQADGLVITTAENRQAVWAKLNWPDDFGVPVQHMAHSIAFNIPNCHRRVPTAADHKLAVGTELDLLHAIVMFIEDPACTRGLGAIDLGKVPKANRMICA